MGEPLYEEVVGPRQARTGRAASTRRSARTRRCSPISCAGCWRTAPTPRSSTASPIPTSPIDDAGRRSGRAGRRRSSRSARRTPTIAAAARPLRRRARQLARASISPNEHASRARRSAGGERRTSPGAPSRCWRATDDAGERAPSAIPPTSATSSARGRGDAGRCRRGARARGAAAPTGRDAAGGARAPASPRRRPARSAHADAGRPDRARGRQVAAPTRSPKCARRSISCATTRAQVARRVLERHASAARPRGLHQPVELSAGDLHGPGRGGAGRRQSGARQARRGDAADRRRGRATAARGRRAAATRCSCCPATATVGARAGRRSARRGRRCSPARPTVARLIQRQLAGRLDPDGQPIPLIAETGGQNAMIVDSSALAEQVVADVLASAFDSAGQRCSALRVLCLQEDVADRMLDDAEGRDGRTRGRQPGPARRPMSARSSPRRRARHRRAHRRRCARAAGAVHASCRCRPRLRARHLRRRRP